MATGGVLMQFLKISTVDSRSTFTFCTLDCSYCKGIEAEMSCSNLAVPPPKITDRQFTKPLLCGPGPSDLWPSVVEALTKPILSPMDDEYFDIVDDIRLGLKYAFQTKSNLVLAISGSGHAGMETVISNLVAPGETMLIASRGIWDDRALSMVQRYGLKPVVHRIAMDATFSLQELEPLLKTHRPKALFITHGDSSTGSVQDLRGLGAVCHKYGALLIVDTVVSLAGVPFLMDEWGVDAVYSAAQKALSGPAGIAPVAFSKRAEEVINNRKHEPPFYFDVKLLAQQWNCYGNTRVYHHTLCPPLCWALRACLQELSKETLPVSWARHTKTNSRFHEKLAKLPVKFLIAKPEDRLATVTTIVLPPGYDLLEVVTFIKEKYNIQIFAGLGPTKGVALRVGLMGINSTVKIAEAVADALADALASLRKSKI